MAGAGNDEGAFVTCGQLRADLRALGVRPGDTVMLHASVRALGWIVGGPRVVLDALLDLLTPDGTLLMLASWEGNPYGMQDWPEATRGVAGGVPAFRPGHLTGGSPRTEHPCGISAYLARRAAQ